MGRVDEHRLWLMKTEGELAKATSSFYEVMRELASFQQKFGKDYCL